MPSDTLTERVAAVAARGERSTSDRRKLNPISVPNRGPAEPSPSLAISATGALRGSKRIRATAPATASSTSRLLSFSSGTASATVAPASGPALPHPPAIAGTAAAAGPFPPRDLPPPPPELSQVPGVAPPTSAPLPSVSVPADNASGSSTLPPLRGPYSSSGKLGESGGERGVSSAGRPPLRRTTTADDILSRTGEARKRKQTLALPSQSTPALLLPGKENHRFEDLPPKGSGNGKAGAAEEVVSPKSSSGKAVAEDASSPTKHQKKDQEIVNNPLLASTQGEAGAESKAAEGKGGEGGSDPPSPSGSNMSSDSAERLRSNSTVVPAASVERRVQKVAVEGREGSSSSGGAFSGRLEDRVVVGRPLSASRLEGLRDGSSSALTPGAGSTQPSTPNSNPLNSTAGSVQIELMMHDSSPSKERSGQAGDEEAASGSGRALAGAEAAAAGGRAACRLVGLDNLGNTCYMNSAVQCLRHTPLLREALQAVDYGNLGRAADMAKAYLRLAQRCEEAREYGSVNPEELRESMASRSFQDDEQHDCQEFLRVLMDELHDNVNRIKAPPPPPKDEDSDDEEAEPQKAMRYWKRYLARNNSSIVDIFCGQLQSSVSCSVCHSKFTCYEPFLDLSLPFPRGGGKKEAPGCTPGLMACAGGRAGAMDENPDTCTLEQCLDAFTETEQLSGDEEYYCRKCKKHQAVAKWLRIYRFPKVLVLHLKRFSWTGMWSRNKINTTVQLPEAHLDLSAYVSSNASPADLQHPPKYRLFGVANHMGGLGGGHYTATCLNAEDKQWYTFNDGNVSKARSPPTNSSSPYILFYHRQD